MLVVFALFCVLFLSTPLLVIANLYEGAPSIDKQTHQLINNYRRSLGLKELYASEKLLKAARDYARRCYERGFLAHIDPYTKEDPADRGKAAGYSGGVYGENLGAGQYTAQQLFDSQYQSQYHRENMELSYARELAIGSYQRKYVVMFGSRGEGCGGAYPSPSKQCDDGNTMDGDGCSSQCTIEPGYSCTIRTIYEEASICSTGSSSFTPTISTNATANTTTTTTSTSSKQFVNLNTSPFKTSSSSSNQRGSSSSATSPSSFFASSTGVVVIIVIVFILLLSICIGLAIVFLCMRRSGAEHVLSSRRRRRSSLSTSSATARSTPVAMRSRAVSNRASYRQQTSLPRASSSSRDHLQRASNYSTYVQAPARPTAPFI